MQREVNASGPVYGPSWRRHGGRRQVAARVARSLRPVAHLLGAVVSTELVMPFAGHWYRPDVGVVAADAVTHGGVVSSAPHLVVSLGGPLTARDWLAAGADVVWARHGEVVEQLTRGGVHRLEPGQWLVHPHHPTLRLAASDLILPASADARIGA
ncbi:MAG TPA: hypothetical protein VFZ70_13565 [Euzebyales bacterium]